MACLEDPLQWAGGTLLFCHLTGTVHGSGNEAEREVGLIQEKGASGGPHVHEGKPVDYTEDGLPTGTHSHDCSDGGWSSVGKKPLVVGNQTHQTQLQ